MNHKHIQVVIEDLQFSQSIDTWTAINDLVDYAECVADGESEKHYAKCLLNEVEEK